MNTPAGYTFRATLDREVARCIARGELTRELGAAVAAAGADYNTVAAHVAAELAENRAA